MAEERHEGRKHQDRSSATSFLTGDEVDFGDDIDISLSNDYNKQTSTAYEHEIS